MWGVPSLSIATNGRRGKLFSSAILLGLTLFPLRSITCLRTCAGVLSRFHCSPSKADFEIHVGGWLGAGPSDAALKTLPEMASMDPRLVQCFYGADETESACPALVATGAEVVKTGGGHHLGGDYAALAARIADGLARRSRGVTVPTTSPD
jgi:hypothetical protein